MSASNSATLLGALERMPSGVFLPPNAVKSSTRIVVDATRFSEAQIPELVEKFALVQLHFPYVKPIFLISALSPGELSSAGFIYETVMPEASWTTMGMDSTYREYKERRLTEMIKVYAAARIGTIAPGTEIPRWFYER